MNLFLWVNTSADRRKRETVSAANLAIRTHPSTHGEDDLFRIRRVDLRDGDRAMAVVHQPGCHDNARRLAIRVNLHGMQRADGVPVPRDDLRARADAVIPHAEVALGHHRLIRRVFDAEQAIARGVVRPIPSGGCGVTRREDRLPAPGLPRRDEIAPLRLRGILGHDELLLLELGHRAHLGGGEREMEGMVRILPRDRLNGYDVVVVVESPGPQDERLDRLRMRIKDELVNLPNLFAIRTPHRRSQFDTLHRCTQFHPHVRTHHRFLPLLRGSVEFSADPIRVI